MRVTICSVIRLSRLLLIVVTAREIVSRCRIQVEPRLWLLVFPLSLWLVLRVRVAAALIQRLVVALFLPVPAARRCLRFRLLFVFGFTMLFSPHIRRAVVTNNHG